MYTGFLVHSPRAAHLSQLSFSSVQFPPSAKILSKEFTCIHFVADHFSPSITGHPAWRLLGSGTALGRRLKKRRASPLRGFTENFQTWKQIRKEVCQVTTCTHKCVQHFVTVAHLLSLSLHTLINRELDENEIYDVKSPPVHIFLISQCVELR